MFSNNRNWIYVCNAFSLLLDINECEQPGACGPNTNCHNLPGNYTCECAPGFQGDPHLGCNDIDECALPNACGPAAVCTNLIGGHRCDCAPGFQGDGHSSEGCVDTDLCARSPCGRDALCRNAGTQAECSCPEGRTGDPRESCLDINECTALQNPCAPNAICENLSPGYQCKCAQGYEPSPDAKIRCEQVDVNVGCKSEADCTQNAECIDSQCFCHDGFEPHGAACMDIDECRTNVCGENSLCVNTPGSFRCACQAGFVGSPPQKGCKVPCSDVNCGAHAFCKPDDTEAYCICEEGWTYNPSDISAGCVDINECDISHGPTGRCGQNSLCRNTPGGFECSCPEGTIPDPDPSVRCVAVVSCTSDANCPGNSVCDQTNRCLCPEPNIGNDCRHPCDLQKCEPNFKCIVIDGQPQCECNDVTCQGKNADPPAQCSENRPCPSGESCDQNGNCICRQGYMRDDRSEKCVDVDECSKLSCGTNALCKNLPGSYECQCPTGFFGNPYSVCERCNSLECQCQSPYQFIAGNCILAGCSEGEKCPSGAECVRVTGGVSYCACPKGYRTLADGSCSDVDECAEGQACGYGAECHNRPGSYDCACPHGFSGDAYHGGCLPTLPKCRSDVDCKHNEQCQSNGECVCPPPFFLDTNDFNACKEPCEPGFRHYPSHGCVRDLGCINDADCRNGGKCQNGECTQSCLLDAECGLNEKCTDYRCESKCTTHSQCAVNQACRSGSCVTGCRSNKECQTNEVCYENKCQNPCETASVCGPNALCQSINKQTKCACPPGFEGNPTPEQGCVRIPSVCSASAQCPQGHMCIANVCSVPCSENSACAVGERCADHMCAKVCYTNNNCLPGEICNQQGTCQPGCSSDVDCLDTQICQNGKCRCGHGFIGTPYGCVDIDECADHPCHPSAICENGAGSFRCVCSEGSVGTPYAEPGCGLPNTCQRSSDCANDLRCEQQKCIEPCQLAECGQNAICSAFNHEAVCQCPPGHLGDPTDKTIGCFRVECTSDQECEPDKKCLSGSYKCASKYFYKYSLDTNL